MYNNNNSSQKRHTGSEYPGTTRNELPEKWIYIIFRYLMIYLAICMYVANQLCKMTVGYIMQDMLRTKSICMMVNVWKIIEQNMWLH